LTIGRWQAVNDPGAWGSSAPKILILGFSKGFTQAGAYRTGKFEDVPFKGMRPRLTEMLQSLGLLSNREAIDTKMLASEKDFAFGSLVRCSLARRGDDGRLDVHRRRHAQGLYRRGRQRHARLRRNLSDRPARERPTRPDAWDNGWLHPELQEADPLDPSKNL
jgi:hypothetical protein